MGLGLEAYWTISGRSLEGARNEGATAAFMRSMHRTGRYSGPITLMGWASMKWHWQDAKATAWCYGKYTLLIFPFSIT